MTRLPTAPTILRVDAALNVGGGLGALVLAPVLADALGLTSAWPVTLVGVALLAYGIEHALVARAPQVSRPALRMLAAVDLVFAAGAVGLAVTDPTGAETWVRWALAVVGDAAAVFGILKLVVAVAAGRQDRLATATK